jgi:hypothetical protein
LIGTSSKEVHKPAGTGVPTSLGLWQRTACRF